MHFVANLCYYSIKPVVRLVIVDNSGNTDFTTV